MKVGLRADLVAAEGPLADVDLVGVSPVGGGCIHQAWRLDLNDGRRLFAKSGGMEAMPLFEVEADALQALHEVADPDLLVVPRPIALCELAHGSVLLLPWLELSGADQSALGRGLALLHQASIQDGPGRYGWHRDGFIGAGPQPGGWRERWGEAFVELRLRPQLKLFSGLGFDADAQQRLLRNIADHLDQDDVPPSLVHGDLWGGNAGTLADSRGCLYDPASWWADREVDLAMTTLFGGFSSSFFSAYRSVMPDRAGAEGRVEIYNLYHLLNHANLFGGGYINQSISCLRSLSRRLI